MKEITLKNFRCFHTEQRARLAPLTLLVGENSTGKTSFLAMIRALWDCVYGCYTTPNFKEPPFDLGSFEEIAHQQSEKHKPASAFEISARVGQSLQVEIVFKKKGTIPAPTNLRLTEKDIWIENYRDSETNLCLRVGTRRGSWEVPLPTFFQDSDTSLLNLRHHTLRILFDRLSHEDEKETSPIPLEGSPAFSEEDLDSIRGSSLMVYDFTKGRPSASAPVRSKPRRTYDPATPTPDPEGDHVPMQLANWVIDNPGKWKSLKEGLEKFGSSAGIFNEIEVKRFAKSGSAPFQIQVRKYGKKRKGPKQNLIDVGYGISQALPILTELLLPDISRMALLQQPEVHLHPSAQAALGTLFCEIAGQGRQLVVETHSDHLIDRISMDVRDGKTNLKPEDVSILFFERNDTSVQIHPIRLDEEGNVRGVPDSYRRFFMEETTRSLGF